jgi:hypothetical protein
MWLRGDELQQRARSMTKPQFKRRFQHLWLVGEFDTAGKPPRAATLGFDTEPDEDGKKGPSELALTLAFQNTPSRFALHPVGKSASNPWLERVTFGRARNNDIVLPHASVSKLHGYFQLEANDGAWRIYDVGSRNHVRVNGIEVPPHGSFIVQSGAHLTIGVHAYEIMDSARVHALLAPAP